MRGDRAQEGRPEAVDGGDDAGQRGRREGSQQAQQAATRRGGVPGLLDRLHGDGGHRRLNRYRSRRERRKGGMARSAP